MVTYLPQIEPVFNILTGGQLYLLHVSNVSTQKYEKKHFTTMDVAYTWTVCANMTSSTKPEVHNVSQRSQRSTEPPPHPTGSVRENLSKFSFAKRKDSDPTPPSRWGPRVSWKCTGCMGDSDGEWSESCIEDGSGRRRLQCSEHAAPAIQSVSLLTDRFISALASRGETDLRRRRHERRMSR